MEDPGLNRIKELILPSLSELGIELYELELKRENIGLVLRIYIDKKENGRVNISDCQKASKKIGAMLETSELLPERYHLEVSSPGLDRLLRTEKDFLRFKGEEVKIYTHAPVNGRNDFKGKIKDFKGNTVILETEDKDFEIPVGSISKAKPEIKAN
jgi:ribosome maturation factor RimP